MILFNADKIFNQDYYSVFQTNNDTKKETDFIIKALMLKKNNKILDIGCGNGRHLDELYCRKYSHLTGIDLSKHFITSIKKRNREIKYIHNNFINYDFGNNKYDKIYSFFSGFGYYSDNENILFLKKVFDLLENDGMFLLDIFNYHFFIKNYDEGKIYKKGYIKNWNEFNPITSVNTSINIIKDKKFKYKIRLYSISELETIFNLVGLRIIKLYGGYSGEKFNTQSTRSILIVKKNTNNLNLRRKPD